MWLLKHYSTYDQSYFWMFARMIGIGTVYGDGHHPQSASVPLCCWKAMAPNS